MKAVPCVVAALTLAVVLTPAASFGYTNIALGRSYDMWPAPNYSSCTDSGDTTQLTDGATAGSYWMYQSTVGWAYGVNVPTVILFDLGQPATLSEVRFYTVGGGGSGVVDVGLKIYLSMDNLTYVMAAQRPPPSQPDQGTSRAITMSVNMGLVKARYVAVMAMAPPPYYFVFVDEVKIMGAIPADPGSNFPNLPPVTASGARQLQEVLQQAIRSAQLMDSLLSPIEAQLACWPVALADQQRQHNTDLKARAADGVNYSQLRAEATEQHRLRALQVYSSQTPVWEVVPDESFGMLSLPSVASPPLSATIETAANALEATALGVANLTASSLPLTVNVSGGGYGAPTVTPRVTRFCQTTNAKYVPDVLLATDCPQTAPSGEAKMIWLEAESTGAASGSYQYSVLVTMGTNTYTVPLVVNVHNVILSTSTPLSTGNWSYLQTGYGYDPIHGPVVSAVRGSMLNHRITDGACTEGVFPFPERDFNGNIIRPVQVDYTTIDAAMEFHSALPQMSWDFLWDVNASPPSGQFFGPAPWMSDEYKAIFSEWLTLCVARIKSNGRNYDQFYLQFFDETLDPKVGEVSQLVHSIDPNVRTMITIPQASASATSGLVSAGVNIFVYHAPTLGYDNAPDGFPTLRSGGRELWLYGAGGADWLGKERDPLSFYRLMHWTAFRHGAKGVHFWNMIWNSTSGWIDETIGDIYWPQVYVNASGYPQPPPDVQTSEIVIPSRRWEYQRMGIEDYMLLAMAQTRISALGSGGAAYQSQLDAIVADVINNGGTNRSLFRQRRHDLLNLITQIPGVSSITGHVELTDYAGSTVLAPILVDLRPVQGGTAKQAIVPLDENGNYIVDGVEPGIYDVAFVACHWLQRIVRGVEVGGSVPAEASVILPNGDVDGGGAVTSDDLSIILKNAN